MKYKFTAKIEEEVPSPSATQPNYTRHETIREFTFEAEQDVLPDNVFEAALKEYLSYE